MTRDELAALVQNRNPQRERWYVVVADNSDVPRQDEESGAIVKYPEFSPLFISIDRAYCEAFLKNGGKFKVVEVQVVPEHG